MRGGGGGGGFGYVIWIRRTKKQHLPIKCIPIRQHRCSLKTSRGIISLQEKKNNKNRNLKSNTFIVAKHDGWMDGWIDKFQQLG